ncbi:hypothetical protein [Bacillus smithii]|uniref:Uncharacterized protein n=1 Tax=Bacillus smithii 7_3_47FAA TaxID=665952 RepID=G9QJT4_9BACI|nr:hypothetical protein [Bacillus smithii]EHL78614.1 hypothetical protein HMPREF1015_01967 [Bacillus smithii 7_3_47FAA]
MGLLSLIMMCGSILILTSIAVKVGENNGYREEKNEKDPFSYLFRVYEKEKTMIEKNIFD